MTKTKAAPTPGPWEQRAWGQTIEIRAEAHGGLAWINARGDSDKGIPSARDRANAALIAAAPDLLAALILAVVALDMPNAQRTPAIDKARLWADDAIRKATGGA